MFFSSFVPPAEADLRAYVEAPDDAYRWEISEKTAVGQSTVYLVKLTSQEWRGIPWTHWLSLVVPEERAHPDQAILMIAGGNNRSGPPDTNSQEARLFVGVAEQTGAALAVLQQVPNQPLMDGLYEDALIAYTFDRYLEEGDPDWPLLFPMVKSATRAMDAVGEILTREYDQGVEKFIVSGASKRGWTTWLTGAVDDRVSAMAPMVIDVLNIVPQMRRQVKTYGGFSPMIADYEKRGVIARLDTEKGRKLAAMVDPYTYRKKLDMPKLVVLGTNDPYWTVDAANLYFSDLPAPAYLHYAPNAGHSLGISVVPSVVRFFRDILSGEPLPEIEWEKNGRALSVSWDNPEGRAVLWRADSVDRDFRQATWRAEPLDGETSTRVEMALREEGWTASFVEVRFPGSFPLHLSTTMVVLPEEFPH